MHLWNKLSLIAGINHQDEQKYHSQMNVNWEPLHVLCIAIAPLGQAVVQKRVMAVHSYEKGIQKPAQFRCFKQSCKSILQSCFLAFWYVLRGDSRANRCNADIAFRENSLDDGFN